MESFSALLAIYTHSHSHTHWNAHLHSKIKVITNSLHSTYIRRLILVDKQRKIFSTEALDVVWCCRRTSLGWSKHQIAQYGNGFCHIFFSLRKYLLLAWWFLFVLVQLGEQSGCTTRKNVRNATHISGIIGIYIFVCDEKRGNREREKKPPIYSVEIVLSKGTTGNHFPFGAPFHSTAAAGAAAGYAARGWTDK